MNNIRAELERKLNNLSLEQFNSVCEFVESLEYKKQPKKIKHPETNEDIDKIIE